MSEKERNKMELKERYIYQVIRRIPKKQREEITMELRELIDEMCEHDTIEHVLEKLGNPEEFAKKYRDGNNYIIGPKYYDDYIWVLKIVLACVLISGIVSAVVSGITGQDWSGETVSAIVNGTVDIIGSIITDTLVNLIGGGLVAISGITLIFALMERQNMKINVKQGKSWTPEQLTPIPDKKVLISRSDSMVGLVFTVLCAGIFLFVPELFGAYIFEDGEFIRTIPLFNLEKWNLILPFLMVGFGLCFVDEMIRLVTGTYSRVVMISNIVTGVLQIVLSIVILKMLPFWNENFAKEASKTFHREFTSKGDLMHYWGTDVISNVVLMVLLAVILIEMGVTIYKTLRYVVER